MATDSDKPRGLMPLSTVLVSMVLLLGTTVAQEARKIRARVQPRPGAEITEFEMAVHSVPVDPDRVAASQSSLSDDELVLGVVIDGQAVAYPIRFLSLYEVVNDTVGAQALAPTW